MSERPQLQGGVAAGCPRTARLVREGRESVRIICFGDSITGVYYHSGAARSWCDMVGIGLGRLYPKARIEMINAGGGGQTSAHGLARIQSDVLDRKPSLVVAAFGMNDIRGSSPMPPDRAYDNQRKIVKLCRGSGAEVVLCTPTSVYHGYAEWPFERLEPYAGIVRRVAADEGVPLADSYAEFEGIRARDPVAWMLLMSEWIHPNMNGHKVIAEAVLRAAVGDSISVSEVPAPVPGIPVTLAKIARGEPVNVVAMEPYDGLIGSALHAVDGGAKSVVTPWRVSSTSLEAIERSATRIRDMHPDLAVVAVPAVADAESEEWFIRRYSEVYNYSVSYGTRAFDCIGVLPAVATPDLGPAARRREMLARQIIRGHDLDPVERQEGDASSAECLVAGWLRRYGAAQGVSGR